MQRKQKHDSFGYVVCQVGVCMNLWVLEEFEVWLSESDSHHCSSHPALCFSQMRPPRFITMWFSFVFSHFFSIASWHRRSADYKANISFNARHEKILSNRIRLYLKEGIYFWVGCLLSGGFQQLNTAKLTYFNSLNGLHHNWSIKHLKLSFSLTLNLFQSIYWLLFSLLLWVIWGMAKLIVRSLHRGRCPLWLICY